MLLMSVIYCRNFSNPPDASIPGPASPVCEARYQPFKKFLGYCYSCKYCDITEFVIVAIKQNKKRNLEIAVIFIYDSNVVCAQLLTPFFWGQIVVQKDILVVSQKKGQIVEVTSIKTKTGLKTKLAGGSFLFLPDSEQCSPGYFTSGFFKK